MNKNSILGNLLAEIGAPKKSTFVHENNLAMIRGDCRKILGDFPSEVVDCFITSPPYGDLKDYGSRNQIGFGQRTEEQYLSDLAKVMAEFFRIAKKGCALWIVVDIRHGWGAELFLPWKIVDMALLVGWRYEDLIIWDKGRSLPWSHRGKFRNNCEFVLLFSKTRLHTFNVDAIRDNVELSPYWIKYPERYHPDGKIPSDLWHFPIPTQGSWSKGDMRHHCPFPVGLVGRMINLTTVADDLVLDPFAGTGCVPAVAHHLNRIGLGIEINTKYATGFRKHGHSTILKLAKKELGVSRDGPGTLRKKIVQLRSLKFARTLYLELARADRRGKRVRQEIVAFIYRSISMPGVRSDAFDSRHLANIELDVLIAPKVVLKGLLKDVEERILQPPLSKFGIQIKINVVSFQDWNTDWYASSLGRRNFFIYSNGRFFSWSEKVLAQEFTNYFSSDSQSFEKRIPPILSKIKIDMVPAT